MKFRRIWNQRGITLIEIMVVLVILGILATIIIPRISSKPEEARRTKAILDIKSIETALSLFHMDNGFYPSSEQGLEALVEKPTIGKVPNNYSENGYLKKVPLDPWKNPFVYISPGAHGDYDLISYGADGEEGGEGKFADVNSWELD
ncbi:MAG: type II secretion system major pseudopilin GspG [Proteobacteria bacterium]|nr:type II secretion system major pseudopilin GspG [Pseudomonadota bacterium]